eukprot:COSAG02_NODE_679_length_18565_cov_57.795245_1_plen_135_part_00
MRACVAPAGAARAAVAGRTGGRRTTVGTICTGVRTDRAAPRTAGALRTDRALPPRTDRVLYVPTGCTVARWALLVNRRALATSYTAILLCESAFYSTGSTDNVVSESLNCSYDCYTNVFGLLWNRNRWRGGAAD